VGWRFEAQGLSRTLIEPQDDAVEVALGDAREVGSSREILTQQPVAFQLKVPALGYFL
jgi:hypothetical protein